MRWKTIHVDFIIELLEFVKLDTVIIVADSVFKRIHFILTHTTVIVEDAIKLFLYHIWKLYSLPIHIVFNRDLYFIIHFTKKAILYT